MSLGIGSMMVNPYSANLQSRNVAFGAKKEEGKLTPQESELIQDTFDRNKSEYEAYKGFEPSINPEKEATEQTVRELGDEQAQAEEDAKILELLKQQVGIK